MSTSEKDTVETVEKLLAERRKVNGWLSALAAKRESTPPAVFQRVQDDYTAKLDKVQAKLVAASDSVQVAAADVAVRLTDKEEGVATKRDERAEAELRAAVGEYSEKEWDRRRAKLDDELAVLTGERDALREELARLRSVLDDVASKGTPVDAVQVVGAGPGGEAPAGAEVAVDESAPPMIETFAPASESEQDLAQEPLQEEMAGEAERPSGADDAPVEPSSAPTPVSGLEIVPPPAPMIPIHEQSIIASMEPAQPLAPSFDELAFLKSVVGRPTPIDSPFARADATLDAAPRGVEPSGGTPPAEPARQATPAYMVPEPPVAFPDPVPEPRVSQEMTPPRESFFGRPTPRTSEAVKSLKCQECGTLNFPTEWYCERCGGELAAL